MEVESPRGIADPHPYEGTALERLIDFLRSSLHWDAVFAPQAVKIEGTVTRLGWQAVLLEWSIVFVAVLAFCSKFLDLGTRRVLRGNESEIVQALDWTLLNSLVRYGEFPLWNHYLRAGQPFAADPFLHAYNPLATVPVLLFGVSDGSKIALFLSFLAAGLGMWWLADTLRMARASRLWAALMYTFTGQAAARFFQGEYDFVLGFAWIPWTFAGLILAMRTRRRRHAAMAAISMALLFFSGNVYYAFYMALAVAIFALVTLFRPQFSRPLLVLDGGKARTLIAVGLLALGLIAIQLLPLAEFWPRIAKATDPQLKGAHTLYQIILDYVSTDPRRPDAIVSLPPEEFYAYTGIWPFLALILLPVALWKRERWPLAFFGFLVVLTVVWIDMREMPWREFYAQSSFVNQFRYPTRMLIYGACAIIILAGAALDSLWRLSRAGVQSPQASLRGGIRWSLSMLVTVLLYVFMVVSVFDVYTQNQRVVGTNDNYEVSHDIVRWLKSYDASTYYVATPNNWHGPFFENEMRQIDAWYGFEVTRYGLAPGQRLIKARPNYLILGNDRTPEMSDGPIEVQRFPTHTIYKLPHSLPYAFAVMNEKLSNKMGNSELRADEVSALLLVARPNSVEIIAQGEADSTLVVLTNVYPGWQVRVDGREQPLKAVGGYLAVEMRPGVHKYAFTFGSASFTIGLILSLLSLVAVLGLLASDLGLDRQGIAARLRALGTTINGVFAGELPGSPARGWENGVSAGRARRWLLSLRIERAESIGVVLFALSLGVYALTRLVSLDQFPIYFFSDEAIQTNHGVELVRRGFRDAKGVFLPPYFPNGPYWNLSLSVYIQGIAASIFGASILVNRATSALLSLSGALAVGLTLWLIFRVRVWWLSVLVLAITPGWFLHSRTGFETVMMVSFYSWFMLFYLLYRHRSPRFIYPAAIAGAATFYAYANGQAVMAVTALLLLISDHRYHLKHWKTLTNAALLTAVLAIPYLRFRLDHPEAMASHLRTLDSYLFREIPLTDKVAKFLGNYANGLSPNYWFFPNETDLARHRWLGLGHMHFVTLPFWLLGLAIALRRFKSPTHRALLIGMIAAPFGAVLADIAITRVLAFVVPASIAITLGIDWALNQVKSPRNVALGTAACFFVGTFISISMLQTTLDNGPRWYTNYGLYGMQWGAKQLFEIIPEYLKTEADTRIYLGSSWANGTDVYPSFFLPNEPRLRIQSVDSWLGQKQPLDSNSLFIMTPDEYQRAQASKKFDEIKVERILQYPNGEAGFYFARLAYVDGVDRIFAAEKEERRKPVVEQIALGGETLTVTHPRFDIGQLANMFDGNTFTLARVMEANPAVLEIFFPTARSFTGLSADFGHMDLSIRVALQASEKDPPSTYTYTSRGVVGDPHIEIAFDDPPTAVTRVRIEIRDLKAGESAKIHIREIKLK